MRRTPVLVAVVAAALLVVGIGATLLASGSDPPDAGEVLLAGDAATTTTAAAPAEDGRPSIGVRSGRLEDLVATAGPPPVTVAVPDLGIDAPVTEMGVEEAGGAVAVPEDVAVAGWYRFGPRPGEPGSAVLTAHVDSAEQGAGAFFRLREAEPGARVSVTFADGAATEFEVVGRRTYGKDQLPLDDLFARDGEPVLTLITCGGAFDAERRSYEENIVVFARPRSGA